MRLVTRMILAAIAALPPLVAHPSQPQAVAVSQLATAPKIDGDLSDWGTRAWTPVTIKPALDKAERSQHGLDPADDRNVTGNLTVQIKAGVHQGRFYLALRYPDDREDRDYRGWEWRGDRYAEGKKLDDMASVRFHMAGEFDRTMLSAKEYQVDVWLWSAARSDRSSTADDFQHAISTRLQDDAAEYTLPGGKTVYIKKTRDAGTPSIKPVPRPRENRGERIASFEIQQPSGSVADVAAKGVWKNGFWHLEFSRAMNTGNPDDRPFAAGQKIIGQIAVFNRGNAENKSISDPLVFDFSAIR